MFNLIDAAYLVLVLGVIPLGGLGLAVAFAAGTIRRRGAAWIFLVMWLPFGGIIWAIVCGTKGNEWSWRGKQWESVQHFKDVQRKWAIAALVCFLVLAAFVVLMIIVGALTPDTTTTTYD